MLGIWNAYANIFLVVAGVAMLVAFGLPLMLVPMSWARLFRWEVPQSQNLATFLGRSVGVFIGIMAVFALKSAQNPSYQPFFFDLMLWIFGAMIVLHVYGAVRKAQPITETLEIFIWVVLTLVTLAFYPL